MTTTISINERTVGELAVEMPNSIRVFEAWKIDYCCGGKTPLPHAVEAAGKTVEAFVEELEKLSAAPAQGRDWQNITLTSMSDAIVSTYHGYTRQELATFEPLAVKVHSVHGERRPELAEVLELVRALAVDMLPHMAKEEQVLFPYVEQLEKGTAPTPFFGTVRNPVRMMMLEHDRVGELLARLREITEDFTPPESACFSYRELYRRFAEFETTTHEHIHVENNLYFPRAIALEDQAGKPAEFEGCNMASPCSH